MILGLISLPFLHLILLMCFAVELFKVDNKYNIPVDYLYVLNAA